MSRTGKVAHEGQPAAVPPNAQVAGSQALNEIRWEGRLFRLHRPLQIDVSNRRDGWCYESKPLAITAFGRSKQEAHDSFMEDFSVLWDTIAQAPDESLTMDAIAVKRAFHELVETATAE